MAENTAYPSLLQKRWTCLEMLKAEALRAARDFEKWGEPARGAQWRAVLEQLGTLDDLEETMPARKPKLTAQQIEALRLCLAHHGGLSAYSIVSALVPALRELCAGLSGLSLGNFPWDPSDFGRCRRALALIPNGVDRISEVAALYPSRQWVALAACWPELEALWVEEESRSDRRMPKLYARISKALGEKC
jgi:hypothetical protein